MLSTLVLEVGGSDPQFTKLMAKALRTSQPGYRLYSPATTTQQTLPQTPARPSYSLPESRDQAKAEKRSNHGSTEYQTGKGQWNGSKQQEQRTGALIKMYEL